MKVILLAVELTFIHTYSGEEVNIPAAYKECLTKTQTWNKHFIQIILKKS